MASDGQGMKDLTRDVGKLKLKSVDGMWQDAYKPPKFKVSQKEKQKLKDAWIADRDANQKAEIAALQQELETQRVAQEAETEAAAEAAAAALLAANVLELQRSPSGSDTDGQADDEGSLRSERFTDDTE